MGNERKSTGVVSKASYGNDLLSSHDISKASNNLLSQIGYDSPENDTMKIIVVSIACSNIMTDQQVIWTSLRNIISE